jgi:hypothetical protein
MYSFHQMPQAGANTSIESPRKTPPGPAPRRSNGTSNGGHRAATGRSLSSRDTSITSQAQFFSRDCPTFQKADPIPGSMQDMPEVIDQDKVDQQRIGSHALKSSCVITGANDPHSLHQGA